MTDNDLPKRLSEDSTNEELCDAIDDGLRNGRLMTKANLAFSILTERLGIDRDELPTFKAWWEEEEAREAAWAEEEAREEGPHAAEARVHDDETSPPHA